MNIPCPNCRKTLALDDTWAGKRIKCPACQETFTAPSPSSTAIAQDAAPPPRPPIEEVVPIEEDIQEQPRRGRPEEWDSPRVQTRDVRRQGLDVEELRAVAIYQKILLLCVLALIVLYIPLAVLAKIAEIEAPVIARLAFFTVYLAVDVVAIVFVFLLSLKLYGTAAGIILAFLVLIPCVGLLILLVINGKATNTLRRHNISVGLLGARLADIEDLR